MTAHPSYTLPARRTAEEALFSFKPLNEEQKQIKMELEEEFRRRPIRVTISVGKSINESDHWDSKLNKLKDLFAEESECVLEHVNGCVYTFRFLTTNLTISTGGE